MRIFIYGFLITFSFIVLYSGGVSVGSVIGVLIFDFIIWGLVNAKGVTRQNDDD